MAGKGKGPGAGEIAPIIIIKKIKKVSAGHHGGAWKVAYADFVTAMMAFFLLLWLLNVTTEEQKNAISNFFDPTHPMVSDSQSGAGGVMGGTTIATEGAQTSTVQNITVAQNSGATVKGTHVGNPKGKDGDLRNASVQKLEAELRKREDERFANAKQQMEQEIEKTPELAELKKHLMVDITPEGLQIQIVDQAGEPMFPSGSAAMFPKTTTLIKLAAEVIKKMPNQISVRGHTDSTPYKPGSDYTNWELSSDRANATRRVLRDSGIDEKRLSNVMGKADTDPLLKDKPTDAQNRRLTILMLREDMKQMLSREGSDAAKEIGDPNAVDETKKQLDDDAKQPASRYKQTPGDVYFP
ncbi:MAG: ompA family protein [Micavibrio sp.]|nr:ompA family protein [Micavibrio sp.]